MGWSMGFVSVGLVVGPLVATALAGGPAGYPGAMVALALVTALGSVAFFVLRGPRTPVPVDRPQVRCSRRLPDPPPDQEAGVRPGAVRSRSISPVRR
jgi:hypothetical protein